MKRRGVGKGVTKITKQCYNEVHLRFYLITKNQTGLKMLILKNFYIWLEKMKVQLDMKLPNWSQNKVILSYDQKQTEVFLRKLRLVRKETASARHVIMDPHKCNLIFNDP